MSFLPLPASFLRQLAEDRLPRRSPEPHDAASIGPGRPSDSRVFETLGLEPELQTALIRRVTRDRATATSVINEALKQYLSP
jgi:hypothetical protein